MPMTLLAIVQEFCDRTGLDRPNIVIGSTDDTIRQLKGLANEVLEDICGRGNSWPLLQKQATFVSTAAEDQGAIFTLAPFGYKYILPDTLFDRTERRPLYGPRGAPRWQEAKALPVTGPFYSYRVWQGRFLTQPNLPAAHTIAFEYASDWAILASDGVTYKPRFTADSDIFVLAEKLLLAGLRWKWKAEKGLRFLTEKQDYEAHLAQEMGTDGSKGPLSLNGGSNGDIRPGIYVPLGNWPV